MSAKTVFLPPSFKLFGAGIPGCGFFGLVGDAAEVVAPLPVLNVVVLQVQSDLVSPQLIEEALRPWGMAGWNWEVQQISNVEFAVVFPSTDSLSMCACSASITLPLHDIVVKILKPKTNVTSYAEFHETWVLLDNVPPTIRNEPTLMAFAELIGKPIKVDESSLARIGPVRILIWCCNPDRVKGFLEVFPASLGFRILLKVEQPEAAATSKASTGPPIPDNQPNDDRKHDNEDMDRDPLTEEEWNSLTPKIQALFPNRAPKRGAAAEAGLGQYGLNPETGEEMLSIYSNLPAAAASPSFSAIVDSPSPGVDAMQLLSTPASLKVPSAGGPMCWECSAIVAAGGASGSRNLGSELALVASDTHGHPSPAIKTPTSTTRKSSRNTNSGEPMISRAERILARKNLETPGTVHNPTFAVLVDVPDAHLLQVAADSCIVFDHNFSDPSTALSVIRTNELAQAKLAQARVAFAETANTQDRGPGCAPSPAIGSPAPHLLLGLAEVGSVAMLGSSHAALVSVSVTLIANEDPFLEYARFWC